MSKFIRLLIIILLIGGAFSCSKDFLDVSKELAEERDLEQVFSNPQEVRRFHTHLYTGIPNTLYIWWHYFKGTDNPWPHLADELRLATGGFSQLNGITATDTGLGRWTTLYKLIRHANLFLENVKVIPDQGRAEHLDEQEVNDLKAQARFFRAYYHYLLLEQYGPVPIMDKTVNPNDPILDFARNSVDEVVDFIYDELTEVSQLLNDPNHSFAPLLAVPTKGTALAVRSRLMVYAASPLLNGGYTEALSITNPDGKRLFPDADPSKWDRALEALQEFIDYAEAGHYELHKEFDDNGNLDPDESVYQVHMKMNKEIIFVRSTFDWHNASARINGSTPFPRPVPGSTATSGNLGVRQELVDDFFMRDGLSIKESPLYSEVGFSIAGEDPTGRTKVGDHRMFINREPRFYNTVFYNGRHWHIGNEKIEFNRGGKADNTSTFTAITGHLLYKRTNRLHYYAGTHPRNLYQPGVVFRLAEFYLLYAEVLNEVNPNDPRVIEYVDKVRERAGIPLYRELHNNGIKVNVIGNQNAQREAIRQEMRVELATEGQRYFDGCRWMIAENEVGKGGFGGDFYGMNMDSPTLEGFYKRTKIDHKVWRRAMYFYPIPLNEIQKSNLLVQNPLYDLNVK